MKRILAVISLLLIVVTLAACGRPSTSTIKTEGLSRPAQTTAIPSPAPPPVIISGDRQTGAGFAPAVPSPESAPPFEQLAGDRMIVRTGNMALIVKDVSAALADISRLAETLKGYVVSSNAYESGDRLFGNISFRIPAESFDQAVASLRALADDVTNETTNSQDVTQEYTDLTSRLKNLEATEAQLLSIMQKAQTVEETLKVQIELSRVRGDIEQTKGRMLYLERTSSTSLINVSLQQSKLGIDFTADRTVIKDRETIGFFPQISGGFTPYSYKWELGDGATSTESNPSHSFKRAGSYTVKLTVTDDRGNTATKTRTDYITVIPGWSAGNIAGSAWNGLVGFTRGLVSFIIWVGIFSPVWIVIGVIVFVVLRRRKVKKTQ